KVYLPRVDEPAEPAATATATAEPTGGTETVLVVEDAASVRMVTRQVLERFGYVVLEAPNGETALRLAAKHHGPIQLLLTDVVMPGLSGRQLAEQLAELRPDMQVLYASGYADHAIVHHGILESGIAYLQKPFTPETLARRVREVLDASPRRDGRARILVMEDDDVLRGALRVALEAAGYEVMEAADGHAGLRLQREQGADLVLVEIFVPERDGLEVVRVLAAAPPRADRHVGWFRAGARDMGHHRAVPEGHVVRE